MKKRNFLIIVTISIAAFILGVSGIYVTFRLIEDGIQESVMTSLKSSVSIENKSNIENDSNINEEEILIDNNDRESKEENNNFKKEINVESEKEPESLIEENKIENESKTKDITPFRFAVCGDSRPAAETLPQPEKFLKILKEIKKYNPDFMISTGDIIYTGTDNKEVLKQQIYDFLNVISILDCDVYIAPGNHDLGNDKQRLYYKELINKGRDFYYYFEYNGIYFIILNAYEVSAYEQIKGEQLLWFEELLQKLREEVVFVIIHPPIYSYMYPDKDNYNYLRQLIDINKVDVVFSGHEHLYNKQIRGDTTFIITGCSGAFPYVPKEEGGFYHFLIIDVSKNYWKLNVFDIDGELVESEEITYN